MTAINFETKNFFDQLNWGNDRMQLGEWVFRLQHFRDNNTWELGDDCFVLYKVQGLVEQYRSLLAQRPKFQPKNIFDLGLFEGGDLPFWFELFQPDKLVGLDLEKPPLNPYLQHYLTDPARAERIQLHWGVDQSDRATLLKIAQSEFTGPLDLVLDDASHHYDLTRASFETLFPLLRPGGLYVIEDWAWDHWPDFSFMPAEQGLSRLIYELMGIAGTNSKPRAIKSLAIFPGFVAIERGELPESVQQEFDIDRLIFRHPQLLPPQPKSAVPPTILPMSAADRQNIEWLEADRSAKIKQIAELEHSLQKLENTRSVRLASLAGSLLTAVQQRLRPRKAKL